MQNDASANSSVPLPHTILMPSLQVLMLSKDALPHLALLQ